MGISSGRITDNSGRGRLPVGIEDFERVVRDFTYVDKSMLARELERSDFNAVLFCRPRRFGKSLAMRMLQCYFEAPVEDARQPVPDRTRLFDGLAAGDGDDPERGAHPVIFLSL
ncbi:MAG: AAA family ATPase, partial [Eggerthellaceae bacterium]|nr:AAA family ATPase [Eggerthellaceae bacterium]